MRGRAIAQWSWRWTGRTYGFVRRLIDDADRDRLGLASAGVAFYAFLSLFPALAALISVWGLISDPAVLERQLAGLRAVPPEVRDVIVAATRRLTAHSPTSLGWSMALSLLLTVWSANRGMKALLGGVAIAYDDPDRRSFVAENALSLAFTAGAILLAAISMAAIVAVPPLLHQAGLGAVASVTIQIVRWPLLAGMVLVGLGLVYWQAPTRPTRCRWLSPGAVVADATWLLASFGFSTYVERFSSFDETYGSVAAAAILLMWFYISALIVLLGAEINAVLARMAAGVQAGAPASAAPGARASS